MSNTKRQYNKPNGAFFWHPWKQLDPEKSIDGSRKGYKAYATKIRRYQYKMELRKEVRTLKQESEWFYYFLFWGNKTPYDDWVIYNFMPSVQYIQDEERCCLENKGCPGEMCHVRAPKHERLHDITVGDLYVSLCL